MILAISILIGSLLMLWLVAGGENRADGSGRFLSVRRIYGLGGTDYLIRRYLVPRNRYLNVYLHRFLGSDDDRALHDHPWTSVSMVLKGRLIEHLPGGERRVIGRGDFSYREPTFQHRIELPEGETALTLFITGPVVRKWGFVCPGGWIASERYDSNGGCG